MKVGDVVFGPEVEPILQKWLAARVAITPGRHITSMGIRTGGRISAVVGYHGCNGANISATIAVRPGSMWAKAVNLHLIFHYPFIQLGVSRITVECPVSNVRSLHLARRLGFKPEAVLREAAPDGGDLILLAMFQNHCRWIHEPLQARPAKSARSLRDGEG